MIVEITGTSTRNKGAELMLVAIRQQLEKMDSSIQLAADVSFGSYQDRARYGLLQKMEISRTGRSRLALGLMPDSFRRTVGIVREQEIEAVLDASGFAFGDQHPVMRAQRFAAQAERWTAAGKPLVLLPQALGPFESAPQRDAFRRIVASAKRVYAREPISFAHALEAAGDDSKFRMSPDFTGLVQPALQGIGAESRRVCIVPNSRMLEFAQTKEEAKAYLRLLAVACELVGERQLEPVLLVHGGEDAPIVEKINEHSASEYPVKTISDPVAIKQFIGESHLLIGSRFHALVSALSQGVPALATSWSHKYEALFEDYGISEGVLPVDCSREELAARIDGMCGEHRVSAVKSIRRHASAINQQTREMWGDVAALLGIVRNQEQGISSPGEG